MLKLFTLSRCGMCTVVSSAQSTTPRGNKVQGSLMKFKEFKATMKQAKHNIFLGDESKESIKKNNEENIRAVKSVLKKHDIDASTIETDSALFSETQYVVEKKIMLLKEMGAQSITVNHIVNFIQHMFLQVPLYRGNLQLDPGVKLAEKLLSQAKSSKIDPQAMNHLSEETNMKIYYSACLNYYLKQELELTNEQAARIAVKKYMPLMYNSIELLQRMLKLLKEDWNFNKHTILKNYYWMFGHHPDHALHVIKILEDNFKDLNVFKLILRYPKVLNYDVQDLKELIASMKSYNVTGSMIESAPEIFHLEPAEFKGRTETLLENPFTSVYQKHPRFLLLVNDYHVTLPRIKYLEEKNCKHATIQSLTTFHNYLELLTCNRKLSKPNLMSFLVLYFKKDAEKLFKQLQNHPCYTYVPLIQMSESLDYLNQTYPKDVIYEYIYAILYSVTDLKAAREEVLKDPEYRTFSCREILSMCLYKIETISHFTGKAVLTPDKYVESLKEGMTQDSKEEEKEESKRREEEAEEEKMKVSQDN